MVERINSCQEYFDTIQARFLPEHAKGVTATYNYELAGDGGGQWNLRVEDGNVSVATGTAESANVTLQMKAEEYVKLVNGDINGTKAVLSRKLKVSGSVPLARKMNKFLPPLSG